ncbi:MAG TPA: enoyl-CoA hydratase/isomerase family protein [bacterium]|nr:enoyl-CoA hydratase/isomerase family protein [bacterium]
MDWETIRLDGEGAVRELVLNRPRVRNAVNTQMLADLNAACAHLDTQPDCRVVILRGEGPTFCAGADLKEKLTHGGAMRDTIMRSRLGGRAVDALGQLAPITIAAMQGHAIGGGACLGAACDFRIGARSAQISVREVSLGLSLSWHSIPNFVHLVGPSRAKEMIVFGEMHDAPTLAAWGFFNEVVGDDDLLLAARQLAEKVLRQPPLPVEMTKASINALVRALDRSVFHLDEYGLGLSGRTQDAAKAMRAFFEGDAPDWTYE